MPSRRPSLLAALAVTTVMVTAVLVWAGWRLLDQQRLLDEQRIRDHAESAADAMAAGIRGTLAEAGERLSGWVANPSGPLPVIRSGVVVATRSDRVDVNPPGGLPYVPVVPTTSATEPFLVLEGLEYRGAESQAMAGYRRLATSRDPAVQAGALLRLGRVQRRLGDFSGALVTYRRLVELGAVRSGDLPAELAGLHGLHSTYLSLADSRRAGEVAHRMLRGLDAGRWLLTRGAGELYREPFTDPRPASWRLANALSEVWRAAGGRLPAHGYRVFGSSDASTSSVLVLWRSNGIVSAAVAASADEFFTLPGQAPWQLVEAEGRVILGRPGPQARSVARVVSSDYPWTLRTWAEPSEVFAASHNRVVMLGMMAAMLVFVWGGAYVMARAVRHEAAVAQLRSDFLAAVSHEFRSPLTAVRQIAEMLEGERVPRHEQRRKYYGMLAAEAARLQRLVETLLDFGRMEAGAERYRFVDFDAVALVRQVVDDVEPHAREAGKAIEMDGPDVGIHVRADKDAIAVALRNLIDNAIKYSPGEATVWVRWRRDDDRAVISVADRGVGIPRAEQRSIFGSFVRGRAAIEANIGGTGVGLAIVQQIVAAHGGEIRLESEPGRGSTFTLLLPAAG